MRWASPAAALAIDAASDRRSSSSAMVERGEVAERPGPLDGDVHVDGLVLDRLERTDRHAELLRGR